MPSASLNSWRNDRIPRLGEIDAPCASCASAVPPNSHLIDENFRGFILLLSAHFQGFCRDIYTECAMIISSEVRLDLRALVQGQFTTNRRIDAGNPNIENLKKDFERFGFKFAMADRDPANHTRLAHLKALNEWRNIAAHQGVVPPSGLPTLTTIQGWRDSCEGLATSLDDILYNELQSLLHRRPWFPEEARVTAMSESMRPEPVRAFNLGDRVRIKHYARGPAKVVELRGALGPGGEEVYRVRVGRKPYTSYIELMESQLELLSPAGEERKSARPKTEGATPAREPQAKVHEDA